MVDSDLDSAVASIVRAPGAIAAQAAKANPDDAARTRNLSQVTGAPSSLIENDPEFEARIKAKAASAVVTANPHLRSYVMSDPSAAKVSSDDLGQLDTVSKTVQGLGGKGFLDTVMGLGNQMLRAPLFREPGAEAFQEGFDADGMRENVRQMQAYSQSPLWKYLGFPVLGGAYEGLVDIPSRVFQGTMDQGQTIAYNTLVSFGVDPSRAERFSRDMAAMIGYQMTKGGAEVGPNMAYLNAMAKAKPYLDADRPIPPHLDPKLDEIKKEESEADLKHLQDAFKESLKSTTRERAPDLLRDFLAQKGLAEEKTIGISPEVAVKYYGFSMPVVGDNILGFVPDIENQWRNAMLTGEDIQVPTADLLAKMDPDVFKELQDGMRVRPDGFTKRDEPLEAKPEEELNEVAPYRGQALLDEAKAIDMSKTQGRQYAEAIAKQQELVHDRAVARAAKDEARRQTPEWKANESAMRDDVVEEVSRTPKFVADMGMRNGEIPKLDGNALTDEEKQALGRRYWGVSGDTMLPDRLATQLGYDSGEELIRDLSTLNHNRGDVAPEKYIKDLVERETQWRMEQKYGKLEENVLDSARELALHQTNIDLMHAELEAIADRDGYSMPFKKADMIDMAKNTVRQRAMGTAKPDSYWALISRIDQKIEKALLEGDPAEAFRQRQMRFNTMVALKEATRLEKVQRGFEKLANRYSRMTMNTVPKGIEADFVGPIQTMLNRIGYNVRRKVVNIEAMMQKGGFRDFESFVRQKEGMFASLHVPDFLLDPDWSKPVERMTTEEFEGVAKALKAMDFAAKEEKKITVAGEKRDYEEFLTKAIDQIKQIGPAKADLSDMPPNQISRLFKQFGWSAIQMESMMRRIDKGDPNGVMNQGVVRIVTDASGYRERLLKETRESLNKLPKLKDWDKSVDNALFMDQWGDDAGPLQMTRRQLRGVMLHLGSDSSFKKLYEGYNVAPEMVKNWVARHATKEEWDWVQGIGKIFDHLGDLADNMSYETSGVGIDRIELKPTDIQWTEKGQAQTKTVDGWYNPIMYNRERLGAPKFDPKSLMQEGYYKADTNQRYTEERTGFKGPVQLNSDAAEIRMLQMVHDIAMRPAIKQLGKLFTDERFTQAIRRHYSGAVADSLVPYLRDAANVAEFESQAENAVNQALSGLIQNVVSTEIAFNPGTVLKHGPSAMFNSINQVGLVPWANEFRKMLTDSKYRDQMVEESDELNRRTHNYADLLQGARSGQIRIPGARTGIIAKGLDFRALMQLVGQYPVAISDMLSSIPTYAAERNKQLAMGKDLGEARFLADQQVRLAHGSSIFTNKPEIMRQRNPIMRSFTSIYGYVNEQLNKQYEAAWRTKEAWADIKKGDMPDLRKQIGAIAGIITFRVLIFGAIEDIVSGGGDPRKGNVARGFELLANGTMGRFAYIRDMIYPMFHGGEGGNFLDTATKGINAPFQDVFERRHTPQWAGKFLRDVNRFNGYTLGLGYDSAGKAAEFLTNYFNSAEHPQGTWQWLGGLRYGTNKGHSRSAEEWVRNQMR